MQAIASGNREMYVGTKFIIRVVDMPLNKRAVIGPKELKDKGYVPDALENKEYWYLKPVKFKLYLCELEYFDADFTVAWSCITREQILSILNKYTSKRGFVTTKRFEKYKTSKGIYNAFCKFINEKTQFANDTRRTYFYNMYDDVWEDLVQLPWAQKTELTNIKYKVLKQLN
jgi:hypothetical protein